ncbi:serum response factor-binding protein 1 [Boleophthalmus pectinirostris]|uniref:serum response factor-binding protein 1 n=1 Tax=Boleophthalmus pectinirostris TaxID=150288 RepID=UPI000A1C6952|nr:serum response factor-binding protein 1 [Boleophthalmus pectinirostris]
MTMELPLEIKKEMEVENESADVEKNENTELTESTTGKNEREVLVAIHEQAQAPPPQAAEDHCEAPQIVQEKHENVLNLNNEVVKMRKEVKRVRALIIRKMTRQIGALKKKKGKDVDIERNQRRAARLLEEIHAIKSLVPDLVTKMALQKKLNFEQVCKDSKSSISDRALARIATHPQFNKKIEEIKAAVKTFKEERSKEGKPGGKMQKKADKTKKQSPSPNSEKESDVEVNKTGTSITSKIDIVEVCYEGPCHSFPEGQVELKFHQTETQTANTNKKESPVKDIVKSKRLNKCEKNINTAKMLEVPPKPSMEAMEAESDLELSDSEKEYFDDSTEERFHKQSSGESEESDNDFFVGKVNKFKKKKKTKVAEDKTIENTLENKSNNLQTNKVQSELDELESRLKSKSNSLKSVFCPSLARSKTSKGAGKVARKFGGQDKCKDGVGRNKDFSKDTNFQKQFKGKHSDGEKAFGKEQKKFGGRGQAKEHIRPKDTRGGNMFPHQASQQPLHPSWEASKKRKEQQGQILAFQGKKIKFDDDD